MKPKSFFTFLAASALALLLIGAGGFYWLLANSPVASALRPASPAAAQFVPSSAPAMVSLLANPERLEAFQQLVAPPKERRTSRAEFNQIKQSLLASANLNYQQDIKPWLGDEITLACTTSDIDRNPSNGLQPGYLLALATKDSDRSREFLDLFWSSRAIAGTDLVFEPYQGAKLIYKNVAPSSERTTDTQGSTASAVVGDRFVLFANHPKVLRDAINNVQAPKLNLSSSSSYQLANSRLTQQRIGLIFVNLPQLAQWFANKPTSLQSETLKNVPPSDEFQSSEQLAIALSANPQGLLAQTALILGANADSNVASPTLQGPVEALQYMPAASIFTIAGRDLNQFWNQVSTDLGGEGFVWELVNQSLSAMSDSFGDSLASGTGLDVGQDIFSWVRGEYALGVLPSKAEVAANGESALNWIFVTQTSAEAAEAIERLDAIARSQGLSVGPLTLGNQQISAWTKLTTTAANTTDSKSGPMSLQTRVRGVHAKVGQYEIFTSSIEGMNQALEAFQGNSAIADANFRQAISVLPSPNYGYVYLDWTASEEILEQQLPLFKLVEVFGQPILKHLRSITATVASHAISSDPGEASLRKADVFVQLRS